MLPFLHHAMASAAELQRQVRLARRVRTGDQRIAGKIAGMIVHEKRMLSKLIVSMRNRLENED